MPPQLTYRVIARPAGKPIHSQIVVPEGSPLHSLRELEGKEIGFPNKNGFTGYAAPMSALIQAGVTVTPVFGGNQEGVMAQLRAGAIPVAGVNSRVMQEYAAREGFKYRALWTSEDYFNMPVAAHPRVPMRVVKAVRDALTGMATDAEGLKILQASAAVIKQEPPWGFVPAQDAEYRNQREVYRIIWKKERRALSVKPGLWARLSLVVRVMLSASLTLAVAGALLLCVSTGKDADFARAQIEEHLAGEMESVLPAISEWAVIGDYANIEQVLRLRVKRADIQRVTSTNARGKMLEASDKAVVSRAPGWFVRWTGVSSLQASRALVLGGRDYGQVTIAMTATPAHNRLWEAFLGLAEAFHISVIAEGVETVEQGLTLIHLGCSLGQGYGIARPMPAPDLPGWINAWRPDPLWQQAPAIRSRDAAVLLGAEMDHCAWIGELQARLDDDTPGGAQLPPMDPHLCRFGRWYYGPGRLRYGDIAEFQAMDPLHRRIHAVGEEIDALCCAGRNGEARVRIVELTALRDDLVAQLHVLAKVINA